LIKLAFQTIEPLPSIMPLRAAARLTALLSSRKTAPFAVMFACAKSAPGYA